MFKYNQKEEKTEKELFEESRDENRAKELQLAIEKAALFKSGGGGGKSTQKSTLNFGLLKTILLLLEGGNENE